MPWHLAELPDLLATATEGLGRYRLRTALSVLGVVLGVASVVAVLAVTEGAARDALAQVDALGLDNLVARSHARGSRALTARDATQVAALLHGVRAVSPLVSRPIAPRHDTQTERLEILGVQAPFMHILRLRAIRGRVLAPTDDTSHGRVCVMGAAAARAMFGIQDPLGMTVRLGAQHYRVIGVLAQRATAGGSMGWRDLDASVFVPFSALTGRSVAIDGDQPVDEIWIAVNDGDRIAAQALAFRRALSGRTGSDDFDVVVPRELLAQRTKSQRTFAILISAVAALALLTGGIGIMNITLLSVTERTKEIGLRMAVGARGKDVTRQFLTEAVALSLAGGVIGIVLGLVASATIARTLHWATVVSPSAVLIAFGVSAAVGVLFGWYPARRAAELDPIDALRHE